MKKTYFFYDLETSGLDPRESRIMQFAGQRTDENLELISEPYNFLVRITPDILPSPQAILVTGITPQMTLADGISEAEFLQIFHEQISLPGTTFVGFNNVRFDDEFIRFSCYRNFYDPYEWHYKDQRRRWDLLDVIRMTRALRPKGINWPMGAKNTPTNKLTDITAANKISHIGAHDALADVTALIEVAELIKKHQPKLFSYLSRTMPDKNEITKLLNTRKPLIYTTGGYFGQIENTTAIVFIDNLNDGSSLVYDLRINPSNYHKISEAEIRQLIKREDVSATNPFMIIKANKCPALAPISVLDKDSEIKVELDQTVINQNLETLANLDKEIINRVLNEYNDLISTREYTSNSVDAQLYDGFIDRSDSFKFTGIRNLNPIDIPTEELIFSDRRLNELLFLYKARNFPKSLNSAEAHKFEQFRKKYLFEGGSSSRINKFLKELSNISQEETNISDRNFILEELKLYVESIVPVDA